MLRTKQKITGKNLKDRIASMFTKNVVAFA